MEPNRLADITAFIAAVNNGSFTAAAEALGLTRSAVGKSVARLEERLGARLLHRTTRTLSLSDEGRIVYERWSQILEDLDEVETSITARQAQPSGTLRLTAPLSFGQRHILPVLNSYIKRWPELRADIRFTDRVPNLAEEGFDIAVRIGTLRDDSQLRTRMVGWQQFATCAAPDYLARKGIPATPQDLPGHDTITLLRGERADAWHYQAATGSYRYAEPGRLNIDSSEALHEAALAGFGLIHMPTYITGQDLRAGRLVEVLADYRPEPDPIRVVYPSKRHLSPRIRGFIDLLVERWRDGVPWEA